MRKAGKKDQNPKKTKSNNSKYAKLKKRLLELQYRRKQEAQLRILEFHEETTCKVCGYTASSKEALVKHFLAKIQSGSKLHEQAIKSTGFDVRLQPIKPNFATTKSKIYDPDTPKVSVRTISSGIETNRRRH